MAAAEHDLVVDDFETETEIRHRDRVTSRLAWAARFKAIRERMEADSDPPPAAPAEDAQPVRESLH